METKHAISKSGQQVTPKAAEANIRTGTSASDGFVAQIFGDPEAKANIVGLFSVLLQVDRRINPHLYG